MDSFIREIYDLNQQIEQKKNPVLVMRQVHKKINQTRNRISKHIQAKNTTQFGVTGAYSVGIPLLESQSSMLSTRTNREDHLGSQTKLI